MDMSEYSRNITDYIIAMLESGKERADVETFLEDVCDEAYEQFQKAEADRHRITEEQRLQRIKAERQEYRKELVNATLQDLLHNIGSLSYYSITNLIGIYLLDHSSVGVEADDIEQACCFLEQDETLHTRILNSLNLVQQEQREVVKKDAGTAGVTLSNSRELVSSKEETETKTEVKTIRDKDEEKMRKFLMGIF